MSFLWEWSMFCLDSSSGKEGRPPPSFKISEIGLEDVKRHMSNTCFKDRKLGRIIGSKRSKYLS